MLKNVWTLNLVSVLGQHTVILKGKKSRIVLKEILVIHLILKVKPFACGCLPSHMWIILKKIIYFIFLEDIMTFVTFSRFLKWVFKHNKATKPWMEMNLKSLLLLGISWNFLITLLISFQGRTTGLPNVIFGFQALAEVSGWGSFIVKCSSAASLLKTD